MSFLQCFVNHIATLCTVGCSLGSIFDSKCLIVLKLIYVCFSITVVWEVWYLSAEFGRFKMNWFISLNFQEGTYYAKVYI